MSTETDWIQAREEYASRIPDPSKPKLPQSGNWTDAELAFFLNEELATFREKVKAQKVPHRAWGNKMAFHIDGFVRGKLYGSDAEEEDDRQAGKRKRVDLATPERPVRGRGKRAGKPGQETPEGDGGNVRTRKGRKGPTEG
jgi:hypothetical protein